jgi:hypothetical protein
MKTPVALKIDFKIDEKGILRIFDIGDGLGADTHGFEDMDVAATMVHNLQEVNQSALATVFGELPEEAMLPQTMHLPLLQRKLSAECSWVDISDLSKSGCQSILPISEAGRIQSYVSQVWGSKLGSVIPTPPALMGMEMHKVLWYVLMQKHMHSSQIDTFLYWSNDDPRVTLDLDAINMTNGVFIKIADRSTGGGAEVYYAKNASEVTKVLNQLHKIYQSSMEPYKKHIFVIEPAYISLKSYLSETYNVTGRAFITLAFDSESRELKVKIAGAKWMFPNQPMQNLNKTQDQMLSNLKHSIGMLPLDTEELNILSKQIVDVYGDVFKASIEHEDLMLYCKGHPIVQKFTSLLRPNASYKMFLDSKRECHDYSGNQEKLLNVQINSLVFTHYLPSNLPALLAEEKVQGFFPADTLTKQEILKKICYFSFLECVTKFIRASDEPFVSLPKAIAVLKSETLIISKLNTLIKQFLRMKDATYDLKDMNRALRQAACVSDIEVLKLLIITGRASVNVSSPKTQQTALDFAMKSASGPKEKAHCIQFLKQNGARSMQEEAKIEQTLSI